MNSNSSPELPPVYPTLGQAARVWARVAALSFGGPAGQIAVMHRILVDEKRWIDEPRFLHGLNYCMLLPGPEAQQLATYIGWLLHRKIGGLIAGVLFILPGFLCILALSFIYAVWQEQTIVQALFFGLKPAVLAVVLEATIRIGKKALKNYWMIAIAIIAFTGIFFLHVPFWLIVLGAGVVGWFGERVAPGKFAVMKGHGSTAKPTSGEPEPQAVINDAIASRVRPTLSGTLLTVLLWLGVWWVPILGVALVFGQSSIFTEMGLFFSKVACVTFGGAYSVLAYVTQHAVQGKGWLTTPDMMVGLSMAETTPGPLIMVLQFVGFMGAYNTQTGLHPVLAGFVASCVVVWATFAPCFLWIFAGAPYVETMRQNKRLTAALSTITAAVVGVILNLAVWFAIHALFGVVNDRTFGPVHLPVPDVSTVDWAGVGIALVAFVLLFGFKLNMILTLLICAALGIVWTLTR